MSATANARPDRIVVVDDDARIRDLLRRYLSQEGFDVLLAEDSKALNRVLTRETVDLIVLDLMLPGEDGLSICRRLRACCSAATSPVGRASTAGTAGWLRSCGARHARRASHSSLTGPAAR